MITRHDANVLVHLHNVSNRLLKFNQVHEVKFLLGKLKVDSSVLLAYDSSSLDYRRFGTTKWSHSQGSKCIGIRLPTDTASYPRRKESSATLLRKFQIRQLEVGES
jgi:hypothetical protein